MLAVIRRNAQHMSHLIEDLLRLSRLGHRAIPAGRRGRHARGGRDRAGRDPRAHPELVIDLRPRRAADRDRKRRAAPSGLDQPARQCGEVLATEAGRGRRGRGTRRGRRAPLHGHRSRAPASIRGTQTSSSRCSSVSTARADFEGTGVGPRAGAANRRAPRRSRVGRRSARDRRDLRLRPPGARPADRPLEHRRERVPPPARRPRDGAHCAIRTRHESSRTASLRLARSQARDASPTSDARTRP